MVSLDWLKERREEEAGRLKQAEADIYYFQGRLALLDYLIAEFDNSEDDKEPCEQ